MKIKQKTPKTPKKKYSLTLNESELTLLAALIDFPSWVDQPANIKDFLVSLYNEIPWHLTTQLGESGYVNKTSFVED